MFFVKVFRIDIMRICGGCGGLGSVRVTCNNCAGRGYNIKRSSFCCCGNIMDGLGVRMPCYLCDSRADISESCHHCINGSINLICPRCDGIGREE